MTGPPCTQSTSGALEVAEAPSGSTSHPLIVAPSAAVTDTSSTRPGTSSGVPGACSLTGSEPGAVRSILTGVGGSLIAARSAYSARPSGAGHRQSYAASSLVILVT